MLQEDMQHVLGEQQFLTASRIAAEINDSLVDRKAALKLIAKEIDAPLIGNPTALQARLDQRPILSILFNGGTWISGLDGIVIASSFPVLIGKNYAEQEYLTTVFKEGLAAIGKPIADKVSNDPVIGIAVPIRDATGKVIGAIAGITDLSKTNFLDTFVKSEYGATGGFLLNSGKYRLIITATDKTRIMQPLPQSGINAMLDRYISGYEGFGVSVNSKGVAELSAAKGIPEAQWFVGVVIPTVEAFAPVYDMQKRMLWATILLTLLAGGLTWWMLQLQLSPMLRTARTLARMATTELPTEALPITRNDEIGDMIHGFNHLLKNLLHQETALIASEYRWKFAVEGAGDGLWDWNVPQSTVFFSRRWKEMLGFRQDEIGTALVERSKRIHPDDLERVKVDMQAHLDGLTPDYINEHRVSCKDGSWIWVMDRGVVVGRDAAGKPLRVIGTQANITDRKRADTLMRRSEARYRAVSQSASAAIVTVDSTGKIIDWNLSAETLFGYTQAEASLLNLTDLIPQSYRDLHVSGLNHLMAGGEPRTGRKVVEYAGLHKDGSEFPIEVSVSHWDLSDERFVTGIIRDITDRKQLEHQVRQLAFHDALTQLPNRRLLDDRLRQTMSASKRSGNFGALMALDLDNFKSLNDAHGHHAGDLLLLEVTKRLLDCVRETDTVARVGGDEFVVLLGELNADEAESARQANEVAEKIRSSLAEPYRLALSEGAQEGAQEGAMVQHRCSASIGVALFSNHSASQADLLKWADAAMYQAKESGRNVVRFHGLTQFTQT